MHLYWCYVSNIFYMFDSTYSMHGCKSWPNRDDGYGEYSIRPGLEAKFCYKKDFLGTFGFVHCRRKYVNLELNDLKSSEDIRSQMVWGSVSCKMPRKPSRHYYQLLRCRPLTFSPFARSMAMATSSKKARREIQEPKLQTKDFPTSSSNRFLSHGKDNTEQSDSSDNEDLEGAVQADFLFFDPKPSDFNGVKVLLQIYLDNKQWDLSGFVDLILGQPTVGTVVKIENDEDDGVYSVATALNLGRYKGSDCIIELKDYLLKVCQDMDVIAKLRSLVGEHALDVALMVSQRVVNLPPQLLPPLYDALFDEIEWATEDEPTEELRNSFCFKFYLIISKVYKHKNADQTKGTTKSGEETVIYIKPEDEIFLELSSWSFSFPLHAQQVATDGLKNYRLMGLVMAIETSKVSIFRKQLRSLIDE